MRKQIKKLLNEGDNASVFGVKTMVIEPEKIQVSDQYTSEVFLRSNIKDIQVHDGLIMIYLSGFTAQLIPTRHLDDKSREGFLYELGIARA